MPNGTSIRACAALLVLSCGPVTSHASDEPSGVLRECRVVSTEDPFPDSARRKHSQGRALIGAQLPTKGRLTKLIVLASEPSSDFGAAAVRALKAFHCPSGRSIVEKAEGYKISVVFGFKSEPLPPPFEMNDAAIEITTTAIRR